MGARFTGRIAAITGGGSGIGQGIAHALAEEGALVYCLDRESATGTPESCTPIDCDVGDETSVRAAVHHILAGCGRVDHVVVAAGVRGPDRSAEDTTVADFDDVLNVDLRGVFLTFREFARPMLDCGFGSMVAIASMSGTRVVNVPQRTVAYNTAKAGVTAMVRTLAVEWGPRGVRVNAVSPGYVSTPFIGEDAALHDRWTCQTVAGRFASTQEIAAAAMYLLSDEAGYCYGTDLLVDGGYSLP